MRADATTEDAEFIFYDVARRRKYFIGMDETVNFKSASLEIIWVQRDCIRVLSIRGSNRHKIKSSPSKSAITNAGRFFVALKSENGNGDTKIDPFWKLLNDLPRIF